uniref:EGF-like domain-containing protein n=1 Tax=Plectus sambesii TaxID=2011161 RepID=A0A914VZM4_9BILA
MYRVLAALLLVFVAIAVSNQMRCAHGVWEVDHCECEDDYVGQRCERRMHCSSYMRSSDGSCLSCQKWWEGANCDAIMCNSEYGTATKDLLMCVCVKPYTGEHCEIITTEDIYVFYNQKMAQWGPIGALSLIPMIAFLMVCNFFAKRRHNKRVQRALGYDQFYDDDDGNSSIIQDLQGSYKGP